MTKCVNYADYLSVMHYDKTAFASDPKKPTMVTKNPKYQVESNFCISFLLKLQGPDYSRCIFKRTGTWIDQQIVDS